MFTQRGLFQGGDTGFAFGPRVLVCYFDGPPWKHSNVKTRLWPIKYLFWVDIIFEGEKCLESATN